MKKLSCLSLLFMLLVTTACTSLDNVSVESLLSAKPTREESFASTQEAYLLYPEDERVLYNYAYMLLYYGQYEDAVRICDEALALSPRSLRFLYLKAAALKAEGRHQSFISTLEDILSFDTANTDVMLELAGYYDTFFKKDEAVHYASEVLKYDPENRTAIGILAHYSDYFRSIAGAETEEKAAQGNYGEKGMLPEMNIASATELFSSHYRKAETLI